MPASGQGRAATGETAADPSMGPAAVDLPGRAAVDLTPPRMTTAIASVVNLASFQNSHSPGSLSRILGVDLALPQPTTIITSVVANGLGAPLLFSEATAINFQIPRELATGQVDLSVVRQGQVLATRAITLSQFAPGIFTVDGTGQGRAVAENQFGAQLTDATRANPGEQVSVYVNGLGATVPPVATGQIPSAPLPTAVQPGVFLAGQAAAVVASVLGTSSLGVYKVTFTVPAQTPVGDQPVFVQMGALVSNIATIPVAGVTPPTPPTAAPVAPGSGSGSSQIFTAVFSDVNGAADVEWGQMLIGVSPTGGGQPFCLIHFDAAGNGLWVYGEGGFFIGPITPGTASGALQNGACAVNTSQASATRSGNTVTVNVPVVFKEGFAGAKKVYLRTRDKTGNDTGFLERGAWTVLAVANALLTLTPLNALGSAETFQAVYPDAPGFTGINLGWAQLLIAVAANGGGQAFCLVHYDRAGNGLWLYGDGGFFVGPVTPGTSSTLLKNRACEVDTQRTRAANVNGALELEPTLLFNKDFAGAKNVYLRTLNALGADSGFGAATTFTVTTGPSPVSVAPSDGSGSTQTFTGRYYDPDGATQIAWAQLLLATASNGGGRPFCFVHYDRAGNGLWLYGDSGFFVGPVAPGTASNLLETGACRVATAAATASAAGNVLTVNVPITFKPTMPGAVKTLLRAMDQPGADSGWKEKGRWDTGGGGGAGADYGEDASPGEVTLQGVAANSFNSLSEQARFVLTGANYSLDGQDTRAWNHGALIPAARINVTAGEVRISGPWVNGRNALMLATYDVEGRTIVEEVVFYAGSNIVDVNVRENGVAVSNVTVKAVLVDNQAVGAQVVSATGTARFTNVPSVTLNYSATAGGNRWGTSSTTGSTPVVIVNITGLGAPSPVNNNDFSGGLAGWNVGSAPVVLIPNSSYSEASAFALEAEQSLDSRAPRSVTAGDPADTDLQLGTSGEGPQSISRTFTVKAGSKSARVRFRFVTREVPGGFFGSQFNDAYSISLRASGGALATEANSMNGLGRGAFTADGETGWRELSLSGLADGQNVQLDVSVTNVGDGAYDSMLVIDFVAEGKLSVTRLDLTDMPNKLSAKKPHLFDGPLRYLSVDQHTYFGGFTEIYGSLILNGAVGDRVTETQLEVLEKGKVRGIAQLAPAVASQVLRPFDNNGTISVPDKTLLFRLPAPAQPEPYAENGTLTLRLRVKTQGGDEVAKEYGTVGYGAGPSDQTVAARVDKLVRYTRTNRFNADDVPGGDAWIKPTVKGMAESFPSSLLWGDFSNMNGGAFAPHSSHQDGVDIDATFGGYANPARSGNEVCKRWPLTAAAATQLLTYLNGSAHLARIQMVFAAFNPKSAQDPFAGVIKTATLTDGRPALSVVRPDNCHDTHFHVRFLPD